MVDCVTEIDDEFQLVRVTVSGGLDIVTGSNIIREARQASLKHKYNILYDVREASLDASLTDFYMLARNKEIFNDPAMLSTRVGILTPPGTDMTNYRFYANTAFNVGLTVKVSRDEGELIQWLARKN